MLYGQRLTFNGSPDSIVEYVKAILPLVGNIQEFEVCRDYEDAPHKLTDEEGYTAKYTFILKDDRENEIWLDSLCGYGGSGPIATI